MFTFTDEGTAAIDWVDEIPGYTSSIGKPILAVIPGLTSDNNEIYVTNLLIEAK